MISVSVLRSETFEFVVTSQKTVKYVYSAMNLLIIEYLRPVRRHWRVGGLFNIDYYWFEEYCSNTEVNLSMFQVIYDQC